MSDLLPPYRVSAFHEFHLSHGAIMGELGRWRIARRYSDARAEAEALAEACALVDISPIRTIEILGAGVDGWLSASCGLSRPLAVGEVRRAGEDLIARLRPDRVWQRLAFDPTACVDEPEDLPRAAAGVWVADRSHGIAGIGLAGPRAAEVLSMRALTARGARPVPDGAVIQTGVAGVPTVLLELPVSGHRFYHVLVGRQHGLYVWHHLERAVLRAGGTVAGWDAWCSYAAGACPETAGVTAGDTR